MAMILANLETSTSLWSSKTEIRQDNLQSIFATWTTRSLLRNMVRRRNLRGTWWCEAHDTHLRRDWGLRNGLAGSGGHVRRS